MDKPTPYLKRIPDLAALLGKKSHFLLGPRQTGKSSLIEHSLLKAPDIRVYDLLDHPTFVRLSQDPSRLGQETDDPRLRAVVIDEIQRLPDLLNEVHRLIERRRLKFLMTGSSARKLRRAGNNLLGGRARILNFHPLTIKELGSAFDLRRALERGLLPSIYFSDDAEKDLIAYTSTYLHEEIVAEGATRNLPAFSRFLRCAALCSGSVINYTNFANDAQVKRTTVYEYIQILQDTLILRELPAWRESVKRKPRSASKHYLFDPGVTRILQERKTIPPGTPEFGRAFEALVHGELVARQDYTGGDPLSFWHSAGGLEVDFVIGDHTAVEAKAKTHVSDQDLRSLKALAEERTIKRLICVCLEPYPRRSGSIQILPLKDFVDSLWSGQLVF